MWVESSQLASATPQGHNHKLMVQLAACRICVPMAVTGTLPLGD